MADLSLNIKQTWKNRGQEESSKQQEHIRYLSKPFSKQTISSWSVENRKSWGKP
jgi:hypothetical protein